MDELDGGFIFFGGNNIVSYVRVNMMEEPRLKGFFHVSDTRGGGDYTMWEGLLGQRVLARSSSIRPFDM